MKSILSLAIAAALFWAARGFSGEMPRVTGGESCNQGGCYRETYYRPVHHHHHPAPPPRPPRYCRPRPQCYPGPVRWSGWRVRPRNWGRVCFVPGPFSVCWGW